MLHQMFKSVIDQDRAAVVICDTEHTIVYMNPAAVQNYANRGGAELVGKSLTADSRCNCHDRTNTDILSTGSCCYQCHTDCKDNQL